MEARNASRLVSSASVAILVAIAAWMIVAVWPAWLNSLLISKKTFLSTILNGVTVASLYFLVAAGFSLIFGLMRNVNLAHGSLYLLGAYVGYEMSTRTGWWSAGAAGAFLVLALVSALLQVTIFRYLEGNDYKQTLVSIGISIVLADLMLAYWTGNTYQIVTPDWLRGAVSAPIVTAVTSAGEPLFLTYPVLRLSTIVMAILVGAALWVLINRTRLGMMVRAGVDDREMLSAAGVNVQLLFAVVFAIGGGLAGLAGTVGGTVLSISPGEDARYMLASLVVVIVGGMGSIAGAALGALIVGLAEQLGLVYLPPYGIVLTFLIMVSVLAVRPQGLLGRVR